MDNSIRYIKGVGEARAKLFEKLDIHTLRDLIAYFPRSYEDRTAIKTIAEMVIDVPCCFSATIAGGVQTSFIRKGLEISKVRVFDETGFLNLTFFNQSYIKTALEPGEAYVFYGTLTGDYSKYEVQNPVFEREAADGHVTRRIVPVYRLTAGISSGMLSKAIAQGLAACSDSLPDYIPTEVRSKYTLAHARFAYENIHNPKDLASLELARRHLIFEELFILSIGLSLLKKRRGVRSGIKFEVSDLTAFYEALPFSLTGAQKRAIDDAVSDMCSGLPMNRLIQGDVGSGKTVVGAGCAYIAFKNGKQTAFMVPTEVLAQQHYKTLTALLQPLGLTVGLLTGSTKGKKALLTSLSSGKIDVLVGTHALISAGVEFSSLGLLIVDEQHRFGVNQRARLAAKGENPHILVMSATPIPRTLALIMYGDLDASIIDELPPGRQAIETFAVGEDMRGRITAFIKKLVGEGRQVFIVCPAVEENPELKSAEQLAAELKANVFPDLKIGLVHGKMKDKDQAMADFADGLYDILVATTVIELGVDVPNAALMIIENAERFGLSQLHQLRGRVGRGVHKSYCILMSSLTGETAKERLGIMQKTNDGFLIAEEDLKIRGPGDFFGSRQHGLPQLKIADLATDIRVLKEAQEAAVELLSADPELKSHPALIKRIQSLFRDEGEIFN